MANCVVTLEIKEYHPDNLNFTSFTFVFRSDIKAFEEEISFINKNSLLHHASTKKDIKYTIKVMKAKALVGIAEFIIPQAVLVKKEEAHAKLCSVTMTESIRRMILGNNWLSDSLKILIHASIQYLKKAAPKQSHSLPRQEEIDLIDKSLPIANIHKIKSDLYERVAGPDTKTPPLNAVKVLTYRKPVNSIKKSSSHERSNSSPNKDKVHSEAYHTNVNSSIRISQLSDKKSSTSDKDTISCDVQQSIPFKIDGAHQQAGDSDTIKAFHSFTEKCLNDISKLSSLQDVTDEEMLLNRTKEIIRRIMAIQTEYHRRIGSCIQLNNSMRTLIGLYNEHSNHILSQQYRLSRRNEAFDFRHSLADALVNNRLQVIQDAIPIAKDEGRLYNKVFDKLSTRQHILRMNVLEKQTKDEKLLSSILKSILQSNSKVINDIPQAMQPALGHLIKKYSFQYMLDSKDLLRVKSSKGGLKEGKKEDKNADSEEEEKNLEECDTVHVISNSIDETDVKLDRYLNYFYSKRKIVKIPLKKTSPFNYEYGSQKIMIKSEGETFRVKHIGKYVILDKFLEVNAPIEDEKIKNAALKAKSKNQSQNQNPLTKRSQGGSGSKTQRSNK